MLETRFGFRRLSASWVIASFMLVGMLSFSTARAQTIDTVGHFVKAFTVNLENKASQDAVQLPSFTVNVSVGVALGDSTISVTLKNTNFSFVERGPYKVTVLSGTLKADSARVSADSSTLTIQLTGTGTADTLTVSPVYVVANTTTAFNNGSTVDSLHLAIGTISGKGLGLILLPGSVYQATISTPPASPVVAGANITATLTLKDFFGNVSGDSNTVVPLAAVLDPSHSSPNGTLTQTGLVKTLTLGAPGTDTYAYTATYTKAEPIDLSFSTLAGTIYSGQVVVNPGTASNLQVTRPATETFTVGGAALGSWVGYVTDKFSNPIDVSGTGAAYGADVAGVYLHVDEATSHNGVVSGTGFAGDSMVFVAGAAGKTANISFLPSNFYVGSDSLVFSLKLTGSPIAKYIDPSIVINPGPATGVIVDYSGTTNGTAVTESIAAGTTVWARAFLRDTYGNPVNVTSSTGVFTISGKNGLGTALGTATLTSLITENQYPNTVKTAIGAAIPYTVSTNVRASGADSILATSGAYSTTLTIQNRSNIPASIKNLALELFGSSKGVGPKDSKGLTLLTAGQDSSLIASNYANTMTLVDTVKDQYGNLCVAPGTVTIAPLKAQYAIYYSTGGLVKFVR
ncbi:MAG: hypothetical protein WAO19_00855, partial [Candidatus Kryptoniota bacterium]